MATGFSDEEENPGIIDMFEGKLEAVYTIKDLLYKFSLIIYIKCYAYGTVSVLAKWHILLLPRDSYTDSYWRTRN